MAAALLLGAQAWTAAPALAQEVGEAGHLLKIIEEQQRRLDAQDAALEEQKQALEALRREVESLQGRAPPSTSAHAATTPATPVTPGPSEPGHPGFEDLVDAMEAAQNEWPGSFGVPGGKTRFQISGFAELDVMHDTGRIQTPGAFVPAFIVTPNTPGARPHYDQTNFSVQSTRLALETRTALGARQITTFVGVDLLSDLTTTAPQFHLRQAYGEVSDALFGGTLRFGHDWATYTNVDSIPNMLDAQAPNAVFVTRHPQVRWTKGVGQGLKLMLAAEATDVHLFEGATSASRWPDGVVSLVRESEASLLQGSLLVRDLRASDSDGGVASTTGWGANLTGRLHFPGAWRQDFVSFSLTYGDGIGGVMNDTPPDASYDPTTGRLVALPTWAWYAGYQHWWNPKFYSVVIYGRLEQDTQAFQAPGAYRRTEYSSANLTWMPSDQWLLGIEALYGTREDKDGATGSNFRGLFVTRFSF